MFSSFFSPASSAKEKPAAALMKLPVEKNMSGQPRPKAPSKDRQKELRQWERTRKWPTAGQIKEDSSGEEGSEEGKELQLDVMSDYGGSDQSPKSPGVKSPKDGANNLEPLSSYEQRVLKLERGDATQGDTSKSTNANKQQDVDKDTIQKARDHHHRKKLLMREKLLEEERLNKEMVARINDETGINAVQASRVIVSVARVKLKMMDQKMKMYEESEAKQSDGVLRARKLLNWTATLSVLAKFAEKMKTPIIRKTMEEQYLKSLPAPPPPPPLASPPDAGDEELHEKYEAIIERYRPQWMEEGRKALGEEKFEALRNMKDGPASREKKLVAQKCIEQARGVLSQQEYLELLRKAWRLGDDHAALEEYNQHEFATKIANDESSSSSSARKR